MLPQVALILNSRVHPVTHQSPLTLLFGHDGFHKDTQSREERYTRARNSVSRDHAKKLGRVASTTYRAYTSGSLVLLAPIKPMKLAMKWRGPFRVIQEGKVKGSVIIQSLTDDADQFTVASERLRPFHRRRGQSLAELRALVARQDREFEVESVKDLDMKGRRLHTVKVGR
ncbi:pol polyprotein [Carpediemonas membranifera]|uniref:Pol polyprotein n=1 Tax=Carpediemonas membranifera TaxID=201153 RepID=A0A8J6DZ51_9EUKA|nr:pol polyprotein [Carpediemonas membranifera]|eukprot:KAG9389966.1 pol polyprotein [Carpediemonas membranifera]